VGLGDRRRLRVAVAYEIGAPWLTGRTREQGKTSCSVAERDRALLLNLGDWGSTFIRSKYVHITSARLVLLSLGEEGGGAAVKIELGMSSQKKRFRMLHLARGICTLDQKTHGQPRHGCAPRVHLLVQLCCRFAGLPGLPSAAPLIPVTS